VHFEKKCRSLQELIISDNFLNRIPGYIVWTYSHLKKLDLRNNQIESMPTLSKRQSILKYVEHLDLGQNRLKLFPTSFIMSIGHGDSNPNARNTADENSSVASASDNLNSGSLNADEKFC
jgi:Leucine-rich repeat (LRR) protein